MIDINELNEWNEFNKKFIEEYRVNKGQVGGSFQGLSFDNVLLLHTIGAKSGLPRINPLTFMMDGGKYVVLASKRGATNNPDWYHNLVANPQVNVEVGKERFKALATSVGEPERTAMYDRMSELYPWNVEFQQETTRIIPVIVLIRTS